MNKELKFKALLKKENKMVDVVGIPTKIKGLFTYVDKEKNGLIVQRRFEDAEFMKYVESKDKTNNEQYAYEKVEYNVMCEIYEKMNKHNHSLLKVKKNIDLNKLKEFGYSEYNNGKGYIKEFEDGVGFTFAEVRINKKSRRILGTYYEDPGCGRAENFELRILIDFNFTRMHKVDLVKDLIDADLVDFIKKD